MAQNANLFLCRVAPLGSLDRKGSRPFAGGVSLKPMTGMEVFDSAIKIGLGAIIGICGSLLSLHIQFSQEIEKELITRRLDKVEAMAQHIIVFERELENLETTILKRSLFEQIELESPDISVQEIAHQVDALRSLAPSISESQAIATVLKEQELAQELEGLARHLRLGKFDRDNADQLDYDSLKPMIDESRLIMLRIQQLHY
jgi:hypothetical protein